VELLYQVFIRVDRLGVAFETVDNLLNLDWVAICFFQFLGVSKSNVLETVNLTESPEHRVAVLSTALDLEHFAEVKLLQSVEGKVIHHLVLGQRLGRVDRQISGNILVRVDSFHGFEETEFANDVLR